MKPINDIEKLLGVLGACAWIGVFGCGSEDAHIPRDSGAVPNGGNLGSGGTAGATQADAMAVTGGAGGGSGGTHAPDAPTSGGGQTGRRAA
jgi:hypothetical protein